MICEQCGSTDFYKKYGREGDDPIIYRLICDNCGCSAEIVRQCDRCDQPGEIYVARIRFPRDPTRTRYGHEFKTVRCKVRRCDACAAFLPPRWKKKI